jgi:hypothetical protein
LFLNHILTILTIFLMFMILNFHLELWLEFFTLGLLVYLGEYL